MLACSGPPTLPFSTSVMDLARILTQYGVYYISSKRALFFGCWGFSVSVCLLIFRIC